MENLIALNDKLQGLPAGVIVFFACIAVGYAVKMSSRIPNNYIPIFVMCLGTILFMLLAPTMDIRVEPRIWLTRNACIGFIIGFSSWVAHKLVLKRIEDKFGMFDSQEKAIVAKPME